MDFSEGKDLFCLVQAIVHHGKSFIASVEGTLLTVRDAATGVLVLIYDLACLPFQWLGPVWGGVIEWVLQQAGGFGRDTPLPLADGDKAMMQASTSATPRCSDVKTDTENAGCAVKENRLDMAPALLVQAEAPQKLSS